MTKVSGKEQSEKQGDINTVMKDSDYQEKSLNEDLLQLNQNNQVIFIHLNMGPLTNDLTLVAPMNWSF